MEKKWKEKERREDKSCSDVILSLLSSLFLQNRTEELLLPLLSPSMYASLKRIGLLEGIEEVQGCSQKVDVDVEKTRNTTIKSM